MSNQEEIGTPVPDPAVAILRLLLRRFRSIVLVGLLCGTLAAAASYLIPPQYQASVSILPSLQSHDPSLMATFGNLMNIPVQGALTIEDIYPAIVNSDALLDRIIGADQEVFGPETSLFDLLNLQHTGVDSALAARQLKKTLREEVLGFDTDKITGLMTLSVLMPGEPRWSATLANALVDSLGRFVEVFSISKTRHQLNYIQQRINQITLELENAEAEVASFREENRQLNNSPQLRMIADRKERHAQALKSVWIELVRQLEIAKIDDDRDRYKIDILDRALPPLHKSTPIRSVIGIIGSMLGALAMSMFVIIRESAQGSATGKRAVP